MTPYEQRKHEILLAAVAVAEREGWPNIRRDMVAAEVGCSTGLVNNYWDTMMSLSDAVMQYAVENRRFTIVASGLTAGHSAAKGAPARVKREALESVVG